MKPELINVEKELVKKHKFGFFPKFESSFHTKISQVTFFAISYQTFEELDWYVSYVDEHTIEARRNVKRFGSYQDRETIVVSYYSGSISVKSESVDIVFWDNGSNSKRVQMFIYVFQKLESGYSDEEIRQLEIEQNAEDNWDNYQIPNELPDPRKVKTPNIFPPLVLTLFVSVILALALARVLIGGKYIFLFFETLIALALTFGIKQGIKLGNFTDFIKLRNILIAGILVVFIGNQVFQYNIIVIENNFERIGVLEFLKLKLQRGISVRALNFGAIGLIATWTLQFGSAVAIGYLFLYKSLIRYLLERVPKEVRDFAYYHFLKGKNEDQVREELDSLGWSNEFSQNEVFEAIDAMQLNNEANKL